MYLSRSNISASSLISLFNSMIAYFIKRHELLNKVGGTNHFSDIFQITAAMVDKSGASDFIATFNIRLEGIRNFICPPFSSWFLISFIPCQLDHSRLLTLVMFNSVRGLASSRNRFGALMHKCLIVVRHFDSSSCEIAVVFCPKPSETVVQFLNC